MSNAINTVVTEKALSDIDKLIQKVSEADNALIEASKSGKAFSNSLSTPPKTSGDLNKQLEESSRLIKQLQVDNKRYEATLTSLQQKLDGLTTARKNSNKATSDNSVNQSILLRNVKQEEVLTSNLTTFIQKLSVERLRASKVVADYNAQIALGNTLSDKQQKELTESTAAFTKYDNAIKAGKKSIGDAREYVGQYERANWGLNNSINQITRELPAFTFNAQTGFLALSNNIPILADEINKLKVENKALIEQGKPQKSVIGQAASAFMSWNTVMSLAITLTTVYGKQIGIWIQSLFAGKDAVNGLLEIQKELNQATIDGTKAAIRERIELNVGLRSARDKTKEMSQRLLIVDKLQKQYPAYLGNLTKEQILLGQTADAEKELNKALIQRARSQAAIEKITQIESETIDLLEKEKEQVMELNAAKKESERVNNILSDQLGAEAIGLRKQASDRAELADKRRDETIEEIELNRQKVEALLKYATVNNVIIQDEKDLAKDKKERFKSEKDYYASLFELEKRRLEILRDTSDEIMGDTERSYDDRLNAQSVFYDSSIALAELEMNEQLRLLKLETTNEVAELAHRKKQGEITQKEYAKAINGISQDSANKRELIELNYLQAINEANEDTVNKLKGLWNDLTYQKNINAIDETELEMLREVEKLITMIDFSNIKPTEGDINKFQEALNRIKDIQIEAIEDAEMARLKEREAYLKGEILKLSISGENVEERMLLENELTANQKEQVDLRTSKEEDAAKKEIELAKKTKEARLAIQQELYQGLKEFGNQLFDNTIGNYDAQIEKSNEYYDALLQNAENGSEQEILLLEEKERKEKELQRRKIDIQRKQAIFNKLLSIAEIIVNTQTAISKNTAELGYIPAIPINVLTIASGAIQAATVLSTPLPQYKYGRKGGKAESAIVGDGGVSEVLENPITGQLRVTPNKPTIVGLAKDEIVHKSVEEFAKSKSSLQNASVMASLVNQSNQLKVFDYYLGRELNGISGKIEKGIEKGFNKAKVNVYAKMPKIDFDHLGYKNKGFNA